MFSHVTLGISDFTRALAFYTPVMKALGHDLRFCEAEVPWAGWQSAGAQRPLFVITAPFDGRAPAAGNGAMVAFNSADRRAVTRAYDLALANGGTCEGPPGLRPLYHKDYFGAYLRDPDGNKLCFVCHAPEQ